MAHYKTLDCIYRGHYFRWLLVYVPCVWILLQVADIIIDSFGGTAYQMQILILAALAGIPLVIIGSICFSKTDGDLKRKPVEKLSDTPADKGIHSLAVLPFQCFSEHAKDQWYCSILTDDLTALISRNTRNHVAARGSAFVLEEIRDDPAKAAALLGVRFVLEGSLRRTTRNIRVTARLVDALSGTHLWSQRYDRDAHEFEALIDEICTTIALQLDTELTRVEFDSAGLHPLAQRAVWELYQQARGTLQFEGWSTRTFAETEALLRQALALDPDFAPAHAYLALILALAHWTSMCADKRSAYANAIEQVDRALELAPESSEVLGFAGCALSDLGHPERGIPVVERALELNPANAQAHAALGTANILWGNITEGIRQLEHAVQITPADPGVAPWATVLSVAFSTIGEPGRGLEWSNRAIRSDSRYFGGHLAVALAYTKLHECRKAKRALSEAKRLTPELSDAAISKLIGRNNWQAIMTAGVSTPDSEAHNRVAKRAQPDFMVISQQT